MAQHVFESATARFRAELDPNYLVVFDDVDQEYQVLRFRQTGCDRGYYAIQHHGFKTWEEPRILELFKHGHWRSENMSLDEFKREERTQREQVDEAQRKVTEHASEEWGKDVVNLAMRPRIISIPGTKTTRLKG